MYLTPNSINLCINSWPYRSEVSAQAVGSIPRSVANHIVAFRAFQNPSLFTSEHYKQAALAVATGVAIRVAISIPIIGIKVLLWFLSFIVNFEHATWDDTIVDGLEFIQNYVLQVPFFLMTLMRYITPTLDNM